MGEQIDLRNALYIGVDAFKGVNATSIIISNKLKFVAMYGLRINSLTDVYFIGTEEEYNAFINVYHDMDGKESLNPATKHYNYDPS